MEMLKIPAKDGVVLAAQRLVPEGDAKARVIILHGGSFNSKRYMGLSRALMNAGYEAVAVDFRGHGASEGRPGTLDYFGQLEDDLVSTISHCNTLQPLPTLLGGHSYGSMVALRYLLNKGQDGIAGFFMIAPSIGVPLEAHKYNNDTGRLYHAMYFRPRLVTNPLPDAAKQHVPYVKNGMLWAARFLPWLRHKPVVVFPASEKMAKLEGRVTEYSYNMMMAGDVGNLVEAFGELTIPTLLIYGLEDELLHTHYLQTVFHWYMQHKMDKTLLPVPKANHMSIINIAGRLMPSWLDERFGTQEESTDHPVSASQAKTVSTSEVTV